MAGITCSLGNRTRHLVKHRGYSGMSPRNGQREEKNAAEEEQNTKGLEVIGMILSEEERKSLNVHSGTHLQEMSAS